MIPFFARLAWAYFCSHHSQIRVLRIVGRAATIGLALSLTILLVTLSVMNGFERQVRQKIFDQMPHVVAFHRHDLQPPPGFLLKNQEHAYQTKLFLPALGYQQLTAVITDRVQHRALSQPIYDRLVSSQSTPISFYGIARTTSFFQSQPFVSFLFDAFEPIQSAPWTVLFPLSDLPQFADVGLVKTQGFWLEDPFDVDRFVLEMKQTQDPSVDYVTWKEQHRTFFDALKGEKRLISLVLSFLILLIYGQFALTLILLFQDKRQDFVALQTCTAHREKVLYRTFLTYGCLNVAFGIVIGITGGCLLSLSLPRIVSWLEKMFSFQFLPYQHYYTETLPSELLWSDVIWTTFFTVCMGVLTCHVLARYANRTQLIELLRSR